LGERKNAGKKGQTVANKVLGGKKRPKTALVELKRFDNFAILETYEDRKEGDGKDLRTKGKKGGGATKTGEEEGSGNLPREVPCIEFARKGKEKNQRSP